MTAIMRFILIDKVISLEKARQIKSVKSVSLAEEYLADHFPAFPVLPGVLLLQGMIESASWLVRETENFAHSMILLEQARNVKYKSFLAPGGLIEYNVEAKTIALRHFNLADKDSAMAELDSRIIESLKQRWKLLTGP
jgi:3-hydroxyacyl-[acyl-carrier-protein] dehydratase